MKAAYTTVLIMSILILAPILHCGGGSGEYFDALTSSVTAPDSIPQSLKFTDIDPDEDQLTGDLIIQKAADESKITTYRVYWGSGESTRLTGQSAITSFTADGTDHTYSFAADTAVPSGATHLLVYTEGDEGEVITPKAIDFDDLVIRIVADINAGGSSTPQRFIVFSDRLFFNADDGTHGDELWLSDGSSGGTMLVKDINSTTIADPSTPWEFTVAGGNLYFTANKAENGTELWTTDGTAAGTTIVADINPGTGDSLIQNLTEFNGELIFQAQDNPLNGRELWKSDGTTTQMLKDIYIVTNQSSYPLFFKEFNSKLYFTATTSAEGQEMWATDGTAPNTILFEDIYAGASDGKPTNYTVCNGKLYFNANDNTANIELWSTDGTTTAQVRDINPGTNAESNPQYLTAYNNILYFSANDGTNGEELWRSDGTATGTIMVKDINTSASSSPANLFVVNGLLFFVANDGINGRELWVTNGTAAGTRMVRDINPSGDGDPGNFIAYNNLLYFSATDGVNGYEIWCTDGTEEGTRMTANVNSGGDFIPTAFIVFNGRLYFGADAGDGNGSELRVLYYK
ncbi:MAG TPA: hypothetical protein PLT75_14765 [Spirochaetota bacterium]|nr:hypothetical protein [Spirochaetota bacterium]